MQPPFRSYDGDDPFIFVSYSHQDDEQVFAELSRIRDQGFNVWFDEGISPGESWRGELANAISNCDLFLIFITPNSAASPNCQREVNFAQTRDRAVLAVHLTETTLSDELEFNLSDRQAILKHQLDDSSYLDKLWSALGSAIEPVSPPPPSTETSLPARTPKPASPLIGIGLIAIAIALVAVALIVVLGRPDPPRDRPGRLQAQQPAATQTASFDSRSIAVLPFDNLSPSEENAYFAAGIHEDVLSSLSKVSALKVISRKSVQRYASTELTLREIGDELEVANILQGSVRRAGNQVRISVQLSHAENDTTLWSETYDRTLDDIFAI